MKLSSFVSMLFAAATLLAPAVGRANLQHTPPEPDLSREVLREINRLRANPQAYAAHLEAMRFCYRTDGMLQLHKGSLLIRTHEGVAALNEAIRCLQHTAPLPSLSFSSGLALSARDHALEQSQTGQMGHSGRDGSSPFSRMERYGTWCTEAGENIAYGAPSAEQVVMNLLVDDGVPNRGHRTSLLKSTFGVAGVGVNTHPRYGSVCVIDVAAQFVTR